MYDIIILSVTSNISYKCIHQWPKIVNIYPTLKNLKTVTKKRRKEFIRVLKSQTRLYEILRHSMFLLPMLDRKILFSLRNRSKSFYIYDEETLNSNLKINLLCSSLFTLFPHPKKGNYTWTQLRLSCVYKIYL